MSTLFSPPLTTIILDQSRLPASHHCRGPLTSMEILGKRPPSLRASRVGLTSPLHPSPALSPQSYPLNVTRHLEAAPRSLPHLTRRQSHHCAQIPSDVLKILTDLYPASTASYPTHSYMALFIISQHIICSPASIIPESLNGHVLLPLPELNPPRRRNLPPAPSYCALSLSVFLHSSYCR